MNAAPVLQEIAALLRKHKLEAVMIGNAAAALQGAPVTTVDVDFLFRKTAANMTKLRKIADDLGAVILQPYYPVSGMYRLTRDDDGLQLDFMTLIDGVSSFEGLRTRSTAVFFGDAGIRVAALSDIIRSKRAAARPRDLAILEVLEKTLGEETRLKERKARSSQEGE